MHRAEYDLMRTVEDQHWWHAVLRSMVNQALAGRLGAEGRLLDAGCGTGGMLKFLQGQCSGITMAGIDAAEVAVRHCQERGLAMVQMGMVEALPYENGAFDAVLSLDVLYHADVTEDRAVGQMARVLRPGGLLVLNLPACEALRGGHDVVVRGERRYDVRRVKKLLERRFVVETLHYWNAWLFLPLLAWRRLSRLKLRIKGASRVSDLALTLSWMNRVLAGVGRLDAGLCREFRPPFGSSIFAVARKKEGGAL